MRRWSCRDPVDVIADGGDAFHLQAHAPQAAGDMRGIGVDNFAQDQFAADGNEFSVHGSLSYPGGRDPGRRANGGGCR